MYVAVSASNTGSSVTSVPLASVRLSAPSVVTPGVVSRTVTVLPTAGGVRPDEAP